MRISGRTRIVGLLGWPVGHSLSPSMHNPAFEEMGLDYEYVAFPVRPSMVADAVRGIRALGLAGANVTVPHKEAVMAHLDELDDEARFIGAVNTITTHEGVLKGYNTDGRGFMRSLEDAGISATGKRVMIVGTGGAARAIGYYLAQEARALTLYDIDGGKARALSSDLGRLKGNVRVSRDVPSEVPEQDIVINATPLGLNPGADPLPFDPALMGPGSCAIDLIYKFTPLQEKAEVMGLTVMSGLGMLHMQGVLAFELWTGLEAPADLMRQCLENAMGRC